jgi:hypothetical protein
MSIVQELKRRNVFRVAVAYVVAAWVVTEVSSLILEIYESPDSVIRIIVALLALGLPFAMVFAWAFEVTPEGIKRESEVDRSRSTTHLTAKRLDFLTIGLVVIAIGLFSVDRLMPSLFNTATVSSSSVTNLDRDLMRATEQLLEVNRLRDRGENQAAFILARQIEPLISDNAARDKLWDGISWSTDIDTDPTGARVYRQTIDAAVEEWEDLGTTPLETVRFAVGGAYRLRFELPGYRPVELSQAALGEFPSKFVDKVNPVRMDPVDVLPEEMVRIPGFTRDLVDYADFFLDRHEVTNRDFQRFITSGGYQSSEYWQGPFIRDGMEIPWEEAVTQFHDRTGRPGPATWSGGVYADGQGNYPVSGVSWYEAVAYATFVDKELPTSAHIEKANYYYNFNAGEIASRSNLGGNAPRPVGENRAMNTFGVHDLDGNVSEWIWNETGNGRRGTTGAAWPDPPFRTRQIVSKSSWDRDSTHGIRLIKSFDSEDKRAKLRESAESFAPREFKKETPASDEEFAIYKRMYAYDEHPLNEEIVEEVQSEYWVRQRVEFDLPYGERGGAFLYIPRNFEPPYETIIYWRGAGAILFQSIDEEYLPAFDFIVRSGRVIAAPILDGTFDRDDENFSINLDNIWGDAPNVGIRFRDFQIKWMQEVSRTIDFLETQPKFDLRKLGYYGFSWGGAMAPIILAIDDRIGPAVLNVGGFYPIWHFEPPGDPFDYVNRVQNPVLMINGEYDPIFPLETSQNPMFDLLGTDPAHKRIYVTASEHLVPRDILSRETLDWYDRYLSEKIEPSQKDVE